MVTPGKDLRLAATFESPELDGYIHVAEVTGQSAPFNPSMNVLGVAWAISNLQRDRGMPQYSGVAIANEMVGPDGARYVTAHESCGNGGASLAGEDFHHGRLLGYLLVQEVDSLERTVSIPEIATRGNLDSGLFRRTVAGMLVVALAAPSIDRNFAVNVGTELPSGRGQLALAELNLHAPLLSRLNRARKVFQGTASDILQATDFLGYNLKV